MRLDIDLARDIMRAAEDLPIERVGKPTPLAFPGRSRDEVSRHVKHLHDAGLVDAIEHADDEGVTRWAVTDIRWDGHEFLGVSRGQEFWEESKATVRERGKVATLATVTQVMEDELIRHLEENL